MGMVSFTNDNCKFNFRAGAFILKDHTKILLYRITKVNYWALPGGRVDLWEDSAFSLKREFEEEFGITIKNLKLKMVCENFIKNCSLTEPDMIKHELHFNYIAEVKEKEKISAEEFYGLEGTDYMYKWFNVSELKNINFAYNQVVDEVIKIIKGKKGITHLINIDDNQNRI